MVAARHFRFASLIFLLSLMVFTLCGCPENQLSKNPPLARMTGEYMANISYRDIPGVTAEEIDGIERIKAQKDSFSYAMFCSTETFQNEDGSIGGFTALLCNLLGGLFGIPFIPKITEWDDLIAGLASGAIDFSGDITATEERKKNYYMTDAIAERSIKAMRITRNDLLIQPNPFTYAFLEGSISYDAVLPYLPNGFQALFVSDYDTAYHALKSGEISAFLVDGPAEAAFEYYSDMIAEDFFPLVYIPVSLTTQNSDFVPFISVMQKALDSGMVYHLTKLYNQGYQDYLRRRLAMQLTPEEKKFIRMHNTPQKAIKVGIEHDNYPASFYNTHEKEWQGVAIDVLREIEQYTGLTFVVGHERQTEWSDLLRMLEDGDISMIMELLWIAEREDKFLWADLPYQRDFYAMLSAVEYENINVNEVLYSRVGLIVDSAYAGMFNQWFPRHTNTIEYINNIDALNGLARGEVDLVMATRNQLLAIVNYLELPGFKANLVFNHPSDSYFGFNINEVLLRSIVSQAQKFVNTDEIFNRWERRVFDYRHKVAEAQRPWLIGVSVLLSGILFLLFVMFRRKLREGKLLEQLVAERTRELEAASKTAMAASNAKSEFLANMSHEIRTPINAVTGMTTIARSSGDLKRIYDCLDKIGTASHQLSEIINDILDMSKIEAKKFDLIHEPFSLKVMVRKVESIIGTRLTEREQSFVVNIAPNIPDVVVGDEIRLSQILLNLLSNAVKFTPKRGEVRLSLVYLGSRNGKEEIEINVKDTGIGITKEQQVHLFDAFVQADSTTVKRFGGTGLGLAICKRIVEMMDGSITIESTPGVGSHFTVRILLDGGGSGLLETKLDDVTPANFNFTGRTVLLADDVAINREIIVALLEDTGITVECAENGQVAVNMFAAGHDRYDIIFMDVQMPVMDGFDATGAIRALDVPNAKTIPIIAMTAYAFAEDIERCLKAGMNSHIPKPIDLGALLSVADKYLNSK